MHRWVHAGYMTHFEPIQLLFHLRCCVIQYHNIPFGLALTLVYIGCTLQGGWATKFPYTKAVTSLYEVTRFPSGLGVTLEERLKSCVT